MKKTTVFILMLAILAGGTSAFAQKKDKKSRKAKEEAAVTLPQMKNETDTVSYIIGTDIIRSFKKNNIEINYDMLNLGIKDATNNADSLFTQEQIMQIFQSWNQKMMKARQDREAAELTQTLEANAKFFAENKTKPGVVETPSGLQYAIIKPGEGEPPTDTDIVEVHYVGKLLDGTVFDSSRDRGQPAKFPVNGVIPGWSEGVKLMKPGAVYMLYIPADLGYGNQKQGPIPAGSALIFEVELLSVEKGDVNKEEQEQGKE
ncbi:MAG TPA: FKBP-type peptidyl-prolyl cis-trans isomerase [Bacteroidales bacterium]|mgnify:CR=1 FL=1|nr:FKBP-type peptidyl-prolyl cis-trans isomerase [Bacteroidales bacterium]HPT01503.1 FKBP-type peptidyl-prolyl cis-trans isomerase [Bacteroidales bacterium]